MNTLKSMRLNAGKTVVEVATVLNVTDSAIRHYEDGIRKINIEQVLVLAKLYECTAEEVIEAQLEVCQS